MTRIDFYQIENSESALAFACRLIDKIYHSGHRIHVHTESSEQTSALDALIWSFRATRFIPHACYDPKGGIDKDVAVQISHELEPVLHQDILVNLSGGVPEFFSRFERVAEVVPLAESRREATRINYKFYKDRGYQLKYHKIGEKKVNVKGKR